MTKQRQIYKCNICGNIVDVVHSGAGELVCCGQPMELLDANTVDAAKEKHVPVVNPGKLKPGDISQRIEQTLGITFHPSTHHAKCWKYYKVRPSSNSKSPEKTKIKYCQYDVAHGDYVYTEEWVEFLIAELSDVKKRKEVLE